MTGNEWTMEDEADARMIMDVLPDAKIVLRDRYGNLIVQCYEEAKGEAIIDDDTIRLTVYPSDKDDLKIMVKKRKVNVRVRPELLQSLCKGEDARLGDIISSMDSTTADVVNNLTDFMNQFYVDEFWHACDGSGFAFLDDEETGDPDDDRMGGPTIIDWDEW